MKKQQIVTGENMQVLREIDDDGDLLVLALEGTDNVKLNSTELREMIQMNDLLEIQQERKTIIFERDGNKVNFEVQSPDRTSRGKFQFCADHWDTLLFMAKAFI